MYKHIRNIITLGVTFAVGVFVAHCGGGTQDMGQWVSTSQLSTFQPTGLHAVCDGSAKIQITWNQVNTNDSGIYIQVERKTDSTDFAFLNEVATANVSYIDTPVTNNLNYTYRVRAVAKDGAVIQSVSNYSLDSDASTSASCAVVINDGGGGEQANNGNDQN